MRENPELTATITKVAAIIAVTAAVGGGLLLVLAGLLGPIAAVKMGFGMMVAMGGPLLPLIKGLTLGVLKLGIAILTTPIGWFIAGIAAIAVGAYLLYKNWDQCKVPLIAFWELLKELFSWTPIGMLIKHWDQIWNFFDTLPAGAANKGKAIIDGLIGGISAKWEELKAKVKAITDILPDWMKGGSAITATVRQSGYLTGNYNQPAMATGYGPTMYQPPKLAPARGGGTTQINAPINIVQQPGQSGADLAQEVSRELDRRERLASARTPVSLRDTN